MGRILDQHLHIDLDRPLPAAVHGGAREAHRARHQGIQDSLYGVEIGAGIDQSGQQHVPGDPGGRVDIGRAGREL